MSIDMSQFFQVFFEESAEHLAEMERLLLEIDIDAPDIEEMNAIFRAAHSIKGGSATFGFTDMTEVTHVLENLLDRLRKGEMRLEGVMINAFLEAADVLKEQLAQHINGADADPERATEVCRQLHALSEKDDSVTPATGILARPVTGASDGLRAYVITLRPGAALLQRPGDIAQLQAQLELLGSVESATQGPDYQFRVTADAGVSALRELLEFVAAPEEFNIEEAAAPSAADPPAEGYGFFQAIPQAGTAAANADPGYGFFADIRPAVEKSTADVAVTDKPATTSAKKPREKAPANTGESSIRVSTERVDQLINLVGELVITQAMLAQTAATVDPVMYEALLSGMTQLERNTRDLQESVMSIRMLPISFVFSRFPRLVRDLAGKLNKQVELVTVGETTELDKGLIEKIADPLTHLVRNSLDHGIEAVEQRIAAGKPAKGMITLSASHQGGNIVIVVADDGAGLNREKILNKAMERGLDVSSSMPDSEAWMLIFEPGFSTAEVVTDVSGRGVGMDVVKRNITEMGGTIGIDTVAGVGTTMTIRLPLTLAILDGMSVALGESLYVIPLNLIVETLQPLAEDIRTVTGEGRMVHVRGEYLPIIALHKVFNLPAVLSDPTQGVLVLIEAEGKKAALFVDALVGQQQVVIKSLESNFRKVVGVSGATIMGDGTVALILDVATLIRMGQ